MVARHPARTPPWFPAVPRSVTIPAVFDGRAADGSETPIITTTPAPANSGRPTPLPAKVSLARSSVWQVNDAMDACQRSSHVAVRSWAGPS